MIPELILGSPVFQREREAILAGKASHAYLIEGAAGAGKKSFALAAACVHFCTGEKKPCFSCPACRKVMEGNHPDVHLVSPDKNMFRVDQVRELLATAYESPYEGGDKIYIIDGFSLANDQAQNALLKTLEEPPRAVSFFLLAENAQGLLPTIRSRCKKLRLTGFSDEAIRAQLNKRFPGHPALEEAVKSAGGNIGRAIRCLEDEEYRRLDALAGELVGKLDTMDPAHLSALMEKEKDALPLLWELMEQRLLTAMRSQPSPLSLTRLAAVQDAMAAKNRNINSGLILDELAYALVKGGKPWQR